MKKALFTKGNECRLCPHNCVIAEGKRGVCGNRINKSGTIYSLVYGFPCTMNVDPVEKKPLYHFYPGEKIFSFGTFGCNFFCKGCQNWEIARAKPDEKEKDSVFSPKNIVDAAMKEGCSLLAYTYTEPTVFYEYVYETSKEARKQGLKNVIVSNGYINEKPLRELCKVIDAANIDLKMYDEKRHLMYTGGKLKRILNSLKIIKDEGVWLEVTNLIIPGWNDDLKNFEEMCIWIKENLSDDVPLHISRFFPHYKLENTPPTPIATLRSAEKIAKKYLKYVYVGNVNEESNTYCPKCNALLIERIGYDVIDNTVNDECFKCKEKISGRFEKR